MLHKPQHIAIIRLSAMGDVAMTVPVIRALVLQYPEVRVTVVSRPFFKPFFDTLPEVNFFGVDLDNRHKGFIGLLRLYQDLHKLNIDLVADLHDVLRSKVVRSLFKIVGKKVAFTNKGRAEKTALTRVKNKIFKPLTTMVMRHAATFAKLGFSINLENPIFPEKAILSQDIIAISGQKTQKWIGIAPFAQYTTKQYPQDLMQQVLDAVAKIPENKLFLFGGGKTEISTLKIFAKNKPNCTVIVGKLNLEQELQLMSNLDVMLAMDSGNAHLAAMLGVKSITLWGATHPYAGFAPYNQPLSNCLLPDLDKFPLLPTSVYGNKKVIGYEDVMRSILPLNVVAKVMA